MDIINQIVKQQMKEEDNLRSAFAYHVEDMHRAYTSGKLLDVETMYSFASNIANEVKHKTKHIRRFEATVAHLSELVESGHITL